MIAKINITEKDLNAHPELKELVGEIPKPDKPKREQSIPLKIEYDDTSFWHKPHTLKRWLLIPLIVFGLIGLGFTAYYVYLYWLWVVIGVIVISGIALIVKVRRDREDV